MADLVPPVAAPPADLDALDRGEAVAILLRDVVVVDGPDAVNYLHGQLSQDVTGLAVGASALTFLLEPQGRIVAVLRLARTSGERLELDVEPGLGDAVLARLQRFKLRTKADLSVAKDVRHVAHRGSAPPPDGALVPTTPGSPGWDLRGPGADGVLAGARTVDVAALELRRVLAVVPAAQDLDERAVPAETGLTEAAVSFTKGCYTGQELVARMDSRVAEPPRRIRRLHGAGAAPTPGTVAVTADGREAGVLTSVAVVEDGWTALALVPRSVPGGPISVGGSPATVAP